MKKIGLFLQAGPSCGGTYQYNRLVLDALKNLPENEFETVAFYGADHWQQTLNENKISGIKIALSNFWQRLPGLWRRMHLPLSLWRKFARLFHPLAKKMHQQSCDLWIFPSQDAYAYLMPVNAVAVVHDLMHRYERRFPEVGSQREYQIREFHYQSTCDFAKAILVDSGLGKQHLIESYQVDANKGFVLPYVAPKDIDATPSSDKFSQKFKLPQKYLFYPAQFWEHKNHINLLYALDICRKTLPDMQLVLVGSQKNNYKKVMALIEKLNLTQHVHVLGLVDDEDMPELYRRARALIMPTFFGPTNIPPLEAHALQCPVAISGIYGMKTQLGDAALYFDPNSQQEIAECMSGLWTDDSLCQTLIEKGKQKHQEWNFAHFNQEFKNIIKSLL